ncbi:hypothetical protein PSP6_930010 [Paraburkholderia tropica]|nr:hypothetical protein PSP6_930010 [Paraburkholderia tropica]
MAQKRHTYGVFAPLESFLRRAEDTSAG